MPIGVLHQEYSEEMGKDIMVDPRCLIEHINTMTVSMVSMVSMQETHRKQETVIEHLQETNRTLVD